MIWKQFVPYVGLVIFAVNYFHYILSPEELKAAADEDSTEIYIKRIKGGITFFLALYSLRIEFKQI